MHVSRMKAQNVVGAAVMSALLAGAVLVGPVVVRATDEPDELMPGRIVLIKTGTVVKFTAKPPPGETFDLPDTPANDPTTEGGVLHIFDTADPAQDNTYTLPAGSGWTGLGNPPGSTGFKYVGAMTLADPCA